MAKSKFGNSDLKLNYVTPKNIFFSRRKFVKSVIAGSSAALASNIIMSQAVSESLKKKNIGNSAINRNFKYKLDREITPQDINSKYNNFYEFGSHKEIWRKAQRLSLRPWAVSFSGMVEKDIIMDIDDIIKKMSIEERLYRHRCVEAWAMAVPWLGFELGELIRYINPIGNPKYVVFETFLNPKVAPGQKQYWYPWPYTECLTMEEALNELTFMVTGAYGENLVPQHGGPMRLAVPWKYGFKSIKSVVRISFGNNRVRSFWEQLQPKEYGFWANVNPGYDHPRWSQKSEKLLGTNRRVPTQIYNGYGKYVAHLYSNMPQNRKLFM